MRPLDFKNETDKLTDDVSYLNELILKKIGLSEQRAYSSAVLKDRIFQSCNEQKARLMLQQYRLKRIFLKLVFQQNIPIK